MKVFIFITYHLACILRKKQYCVDNFILKGKNFPESEIENINEDDGSSLNERTVKRKIPMDLTTYNLESKQKKICSSQPFSGNDFLTIDDFSRNPDNAKGLLNVAQYNQKNDVKLREINDTTRLFLLNQMTKLYVKIDQYIRNNLFKVHTNFYLTKLENIYQSSKFFIEKENEFKDKNLIFDPYHSKFIQILDFVFSNFNAIIEFKEKICNIFIYKLFDKLFSDEDLFEFLVKLRELSIDHKKIIFFTELQKCVKYFSVIPELMTLGGVISEHSINDLIVVIHLTSLILNVRNDREVKVFILFLIKRAFTSSVKNRLDLFSIQNLRTSCSAGQDGFHNHDLYFFLWEINNHKRGDIKRKTKDVNILFLSKSDRNHFRSVLLIFMYQHMIFLRNSNVSYEESKNYVQLINDIIELNRCPICNFGRYIKFLETF